MNAQQQGLRPWWPGQSGNPAGRPRGSRHKLCEAFLRDLARVWNEHGAGALQALAREDPGAFAHLVAALLPRNVQLEAEALPVLHFNYYGIPPLYPDGIPLEEIEPLKPAGRDVIPAT